MHEAARRGCADRRWDGASSLRPALCIPRRLLRPLRIGLSWRLQCLRSQPIRRLFPFFPRQISSIARGSRRGFAGNFRAHPPYNGARRHRRPYISPYGTGAFYGVPGYGVPGLVNPYLLGYPDTIGDDDSQASPTNPAEGYDQQTQDQGPPEFRPSYPPQPPTDLPHSSPPAASQEAVTLIFKDGRPPQQIYNYLLTRTTLYVGDVPRRDIPIAQLDLAATAKVNHDAGIDFRLPVAPM